MPDTYDFKKQLQVGAAGEKALDAHFSQWFDITPATDEEQRQGIDRWWDDRLVPRRWSVEYKTDHVAHKTHNAFVETVSVEGKRAGWGYTSHAQWLLYYIPGGDYDLAYLLDIAYIRRVALPKWEKHYRLVTVQNIGYITKGLLVPLHEFEKHATQVCLL